MILALWLGCGGISECTLSIPAAQRACETDADCVVTYTDCAQECTCAAVAATSLADVEGQTAADCGGTDCAADACSDCKETTEAICQRNVCEAVDVQGDTFGG